MTTLAEMPNEIQAKDLKPGDFVIFNAQMKGCVTFVKNEAGLIVLNNLIDQTEIQPEKEHRSQLVGFGKYRLEEVFKTYQPSMKFRKEAAKKLSETTPQ